MHPQYTSVTPTRRANDRATEKGAITACDDCDGRHDHIECSAGRQECAIAAEPIQTPHQERSDRGVSNQNTFAGSCVQVGFPGDGRDRGQGVP